MTHEPIAERIIQVSSSIDSFVPEQGTLLVREKRQVMKFSDLGTLHR